MTDLTTSKHFIRSHFGARAGEWATLYHDPEPGLSAQNLISRQRFALELVEAVLPPGSTVLDLGCGSGVMAARLTEHGYTAYGLDLAEPMVRHARHLCASDQFAVADVDHIPFPDNTFDAVLSLGVLQFLEAEQRALREMWRVLRPGGHAVIALPSGSSPLQRMDLLILGVVNVLKYRLRGTRRPAPEPAAVIDRRKFSRRRWLRLLGQANLEPEAWICHGWGWFESPLAFLVQRLAKGPSALARGIKRFGGERVLSRARTAFVRTRAVNWLASEQIIRARAVKT